MTLTAMTFLVFTLGLLTISAAIPLTNTTLELNTTTNAMSNANTDAEAKCKPVNGPCNVKTDCCAFACCCQTEIPIINPLIPSAPPLMVSSGFCCEDIQACWDFPQPDPDPPKAG